MLEIMQQPQKLLHASICVLIQRWWHLFGLKHETLDQLQAFSTNKTTIIALFVYNYQLSLLKMTKQTRCNQERGADDVMDLLFFTIHEQHSTLTTCIFMTGEQRGNESGAASHSVHV
jgi:hypothetical protein